MWMWLTSLLQGLLIFKMSLLWERSCGLQMEKPDSAVLMWFFERKKEQNAYQTQPRSIVHSSYRQSFLSEYVKGPTWSLVSDNIQWAQKHLAGHMGHRDSSWQGKGEGDFSEIVGWWKHSFQYSISRTVCPFKCLGMCNIITTLG